MPNVKLSKNTVDLKLTYLMSSHTPAVTRVDLCTNALTGVGAAMAAGSQFINGH